MSASAEEQIGRLSPEQQAKVANLKLRRIDKRQRLLKRVRAGAYLRAWAALGTLVLIAILIAGGVFGQFSLPVAICFAAVWSVASIGIWSLNGRIDALVELYESDDHEAP